nr:hypothetical protein [Mobiluncus sp. Marseille-Q7826]
MVSIWLAWCLPVGGSCGAMLVVAWHSLIGGGSSVDGSIRWLVDEVLAG